MIHPSTPGAGDREGGDGPSASLRGAARRMVYKTGRGHDMSITPVPLIAETAAFVTVETEWMGRTSESREKRFTDWHAYHNSEADALDFLIARASRELDRLKRETHAANSRLGELESRKRKLPARSAPEASSPKGPLPGSPRSQYRLGGVQGQGIIFGRISKNATRLKVARTTNFTVHR